MKISTNWRLWISLFVLPILVYGCASGSADQNQKSEGSISGRVYFDQNADKDCAECECGLADVRINLFEGTCAGTANQTAITDEDGYFTFSALATGDYCIFADLPPTCDGYQPTTSISQQVILGPREELELEGFGFDTYVDTNE